MRSDGPACRACRHWKRKTSDAGVCWNGDLPHYGAMVAEGDGCEAFAPKVLVAAEGQ